jgi:serine phosphatase RsbU (regulator of sigma subunit)
VVASAIEPTDLGQPLLLAQWVDLSARRRAERARGELMLEQAARGQAEAIAERLEKLQAVTTRIEPLGLEDLLGTLEDRLKVVFDAADAEIEVHGELDEAVNVRASGRQVGRARGDAVSGPSGHSHEQPLMIEDFQVGVVRLEFSSDRFLSAAERSLLQDAAERVALAIRRAQLLEEEHRIALVLQRGLLPQNLPNIDGIELAPRYKAAGVGAEVGGDWYDAFVLPGGRLGLVVGDVAGRSIPAASAMGQLRTATRTLALGDEGYRPPGEALTRLNRYQLATGDDEMFTVVYAILDPAGRAVTWAAAGHPPPLIRTRAGDTRYLEAGGGLTGISDTEYETFTAEIGPGDMLVLYTDGLVERRGEPLDAGLERLAAVVASGPSDPDGLATHVLARLLPEGGTLHDDVTALVARIS